MELNLVMDWGLLLQTLIAMLIGGVVGFERELADKPAGLRTHMLVAGASALMVLLGNLIVTDFQQTEGSSVIRADPIRIFEAILVGVSFLGTGTIVKRDNDKVEGLTTAASLLMVAALGVAVALGEVLLASALAAMVLLVGRGVRWLEHRYGRKPR